MSEHETQTFERGFRAFVAKWRGVMFIFGSMVTLAIGGHARVLSIEHSLGRIEFNATSRMDTFDKHLAVLQSSSTRDREAIVRIEVQLMHIAEAIKRIERRVEERNP